MIVYKDLPVIARLNNRETGVCNNETFKVVSIKDDTIIITDGTEFKTIQQKDFIR